MHKLKFHKLLVLFCFLYQPVRLVAQQNCIDNAVGMYSNGDYTQAVIEFEKCDSLLPTSSRYETYIKALFLSGDLSKSWNAVSQIPDSVAVTEILNLKARIAFARGDYYSSFKSYRQLSESDSLNVTYIRQLGICADKIDSTILAINYYQNALQLNPADMVTGIRLVETYYELDSLLLADTLSATLLQLDSLPALLRLRGNVMYMLKEYDQAYSCFAPLLRQGTSDPELLKKAGICQFAMGETENALTMLATSHLIKSDDEITCYYLAMVYQSLADYEKSELYFNAAIGNSISPNIANYYHRMAEMYETSGEYQNAIGAYKKALTYRDQLQEFKPELYSEIGRIYDVYFEDSKNALLYYNKFLSAYPDTSDYKYKNVKRRQSYLEGEVK